MLHFDKNVKNVICESEDKKGSAKMAREYSCVKRTKQAFVSSLVVLSKDTPWNKISVKMLCEHAQLSRNAFYFHYKDINDLIEDVEDSIVNEAVSHFDTFRKIGFPKNVHTMVVSLIEIVDANREVCRMLFENSDSFTERMNKVFCDFNYQYFSDYHGESKRTVYDFYYMFISSGFYGLLKYWLDNPGKLTKNEITGLSFVLVKRLLVLGDPDIDYKPKSKK